jgi:hypothetical protein
MRTVILALFCALAVLAPAGARVRFDDPPTQPAAPTASDAIWARLVVPIACAEPEFVVVRLDPIIELRYQPPQIDCPVVPTDMPRSVPIGTLAAGTYDVRVVNVMAGSPLSDDQATITVAPDSCEPNADPAVGEGSLLCIDGRFSITAEWTAPDGSHGFGRALPLTPATGAFWFFDAANLEVVVKVLDGCAVNDRMWVFAAGMTDVRVVLRVYDRVTDVERTYTNPLGRLFPPIADVDAFHCAAP